MCERLDGTERLNYVPFSSILGRNPLLSRQDRTIVGNIMDALVRCDILSWQNPPYVRGSTVRTARYGNPTNPHYWAIPRLVRAIGPENSNGVVKRLAYGPDIDLMIPYRGDEPPPLPHIKSIPRPSPLASMGEVLREGFYNEFLHKLYGITAVYGIGQVVPGDILDFPGIKISSYLITRLDDASPIIKFDCIQQNARTSWRPNPHQLRVGGTTGLVIDDDSQAELTLQQGDICVVNPKHIDPFPDKVVLYGDNRASLGKEAHFYVRGFTQLSSYKMDPRNVQDINQRLSHHTQNGALPFKSNQEKDRILPFLVQDSVLAMLLDSNGFVQYLCDIDMMKFYPIDDPDARNKVLSVTDQLHHKMDETMVTDANRQSAGKMMDRLVVLLTPRVDVFRK